MNIIINQITDFNHSFGRFCDFQRVQNRFSTLFGETPSAVHGSLSSAEVKLLVVWKIIFCSSYVPLWARNPAAHFWHFLFDNFISKIVASEFSSVFDIFLSMLNRNKDQPFSKRLFRFENGPPSSQGTPGKSWKTHPEIFPKFQFSG